MDGGGALMNQGIHIIDAFLYLMGDVSSISARMGTLGHQHLEVEDVAAAVLEFESGAIGVIEATTCAYPDFGDRIDLHGERGSVTLEGLPPQLVSFQVMDEETVDPAAYVEDPRPYFAHKLVFEDMMDAVTCGRPPLLCGREAKRSLEVIESIYRASRSPGNTFH